MTVTQPPAFAASDLERFLHPYRRLFRDKRLFKGFQACIWGIIGSGSCRVSRMASHNPITGNTAHAERRLRRLLHGENKHAEVDADRLTEVLSEEAAKLLAGEEEVLLIADESDLRKPYSERLEHLSTVTDLSGKSVPGYATLNVLGIGASGQRALLYQRTFSSQEPGFKSLHKERERAIIQVERALRQVLTGRFIWILDRGFDDRKIFSLLNQRGSCFVLRASHLNRLCHADLGGRRRRLEQHLEQAPCVGEVWLERRLLGRLKVDEKQPRQKQRRAKLQAHLCQLELYQPRGLALSVLQLRHPDVGQPWTLLSNLKQGEAVELAQRLVQLYRMRWSIEDVHAWTKDALDWESAALLSFSALRSLVSFAWLAASFLFDLGAKLEQQELVFLARLGGWTPSKRPPGKATLTRGLARLLAHLQLADLLYQDDKANLTFAQLREALLPP